MEVSGQLHAPYRFIPAGTAHNYEADSLDAVEIVLVFEKRAENCTRINITRISY
jgi:hypothetical protein